MKIRLLVFDLDMDCLVSYCFVMIGGKWKFVILFCIVNGINWFGVLQCVIFGVMK